MVGTYSTHQGTLLKYFEKWIRYFLNQFEMPIHFPYFSGCGKEWFAFNVQNS